MYSFHSSVEEKNHLLSTLVEYGIETTVDRSNKKDRIRQWIQNSSIVEEDEEDPDVMSGAEDAAEPRSAPRSDTYRNRHHGSHKRHGRDRVSESSGTATASK